MKPGDLCMIVHPAWREWSDSAVCVILRSTSLGDGGLDGNCDWWVLWNDRETAWAASDLERVE